MILLIDAVKCIITSNENYDSDSRTLNDELADLLAAGPNHVIIVTNAAGEKLDLITQLLSNYSFKIFSLENHPNKTDSHYFTKLLEQYEILASECFYIDHKQENLDSAQQVGIEGRLYTGDNALIKQFM